MRIGSDSWSLDLAPGWTARQEADGVSITASARGGVFRLSAMRKSIGTVDEVELEEMASRSPEMGLPRKVKVGEFSGFAVAYRNAEGLWRRYWLANGNVILLAHYLGPPSSFALEERSVRAMLGTLSREPANA